MSGVNNLRVKVKSRTPEELLSMIMQEYCYFIATGGGVTFGGGEPLTQYREIIEFAKLKPAQVKLNIETSLYADSEVVKELIPYTDLWIIDIKTLDKELYEKYTGKSPEKLMVNLKTLAGECPSKCLIRIPIIPGLKTRDTAESEADTIRDMGFDDIEVFEYVVK